MDKERAIKLVNEQNGFLKHNNITVEEVGENSCTVKLEINEDSLNPYGIVHGGLIFSIGDTVMGTQCRATGRNAVTLNASIDYLKPGKGKYLIAKSEVIKIGKTTSVLKAYIYNEKSSLIATMSSTYFFIE